MGRHRSLPTSNTLHAAGIGRPSVLFRVMQYRQALRWLPFQMRTRGRLHWVRCSALTSQDVLASVTDGVMGRRDDKSWRARRKRFIVGADAGDGAPLLRVMEQLVQLTARLSELSPSPILLAIPDLVRADAFDWERFNMEFKERAANGLGHVEARTPLPHCVGQSYQAPPQSRFGKHNG
jgi:hypothetical protein